MSSVQPATLPEELINGLHLITLMEKTVEVLRNKFHQYFPIDPTDLYNEIAKYEKKLRKLLKQSKICGRQYDILLPATRKTDSSKFDISLLTLVLRVLCPIQAPNTGWETLPLPSDHSEGACLVRIRIERNDLLHRNLSYNNKQYEYTWNRIALALEGLGCETQTLHDLKLASLHPSLQTDYQQKLEDLKQALKRVADFEDLLEGITYNLLPSVPSFVGREQELAEINQKLSEKDEHRLGMVIHGLGGVGKSELARQYCQRYATSDYNRNVIWINAEDRNCMTEDFFNIAEIINLKTTDENDKKLSIRTIVNKVYRFFADRPVLFVFDNVINKIDLIEFMETNASTNISVLITSQFTEWGEQFIQMRTDVLSKESALGLVSQNLEQKHISDKDRLLLLCEKMQYHPLALQQALAYIRRWSVTVNEYLEQFERQFNRLMANRHDDEIYNRTIMTTWNMALRKLEEDHDSSLAITLIHIMSYFDGKCIKKELFYEFYDEHLVNKSLELLQKYSLITITTSDDDDLQQTILMHSLLQYVIRMGSDHSCFHQFLDETFSAPNGTNKVEYLSYGKRLWYKLVCKFSTSTGRNILAQRSTANTRELLNIFKSKGKTSMILQILNAIEKFQIDTIGNQNEHTLHTQYNIAKCLLELGYYDNALIKFMEVEKLKIDTIGCKHPSTLSTQNNIAACLSEKGNCDEALIKFMEVEKLQIDTIGCKHPSTLMTQNNIAACLKRNGNYDEALIKFMEVEKLQIDIIGCKHPSTLITQNNIATCLKRNGNYDEALIKFMEVEKLQIDTIGCKHPNTLTIQHNIADCLSEKGNYDEALIKFMEVEKLQIDTIGCKHPSTLITQNNIATCLKRKGNYDEALIKFMEVEKLQIDIVGRKHPNTLITQNQIADCLREKGNYDEALIKFRKVEKLQIDIIGRKHPDTLITQQNIAFCLKEKGNNDEALIKSYSE